MYSKTLKPEIMRTMLPEGFPADKLSKPQYKVIVERDVWMTMRDGTQISANIYRPDAPGTIPRHPRGRLLSEGPRPSAAPPHLPHARDQRHRLLRQPRLRVRPHRLPGHRPLPHRPVGPVRPGDAERPLRHDRVDRRAALVRRQSGHAGRVATGLEPVVHGRAAAASPHLHPALGRRRRPVPRRRLARRHDGRGLPHRLEHVGDPRPLSPGHPRALRHAGAQPRDGQVGHGVERHQPPHLRRLLEAAQPRLLQDPVPGVHRGRPAQGGAAPARCGARLRGDQDAQEDDAHPRRHGRRRDGHLQLARDAAAHAPLVRPLAQGQRHRGHGRAAGVTVRARGRRVPALRRVAAAADRVQEAVLQRGQERRGGIAQRWQPLLGSP